MHFITFIFKNLLRRRTRSLLTIVGLAVAIGAVVALVGVANGFKDSFMKVYLSRGVDIVVTRAGGQERQTSGLPLSLADKIAQVEGVDQVVGGLVDVLTFREENVMGAVVNGWPVDSPLFARLKFVEQGSRKFDQDEKNVVMMGRVLAANLGKKVGDEIELYGAEKFKIVAIYESPIVFENGGMVAPLGELGRMMNRPDEVTGYTIVAKHPIDEAGITAIAKRVAAIAPDIEATPALKFVESVSQIKMASAVAWVTSAIAVIIGAIGMLNTMIMSVFERTKEIGTLRAIGWKKSRIIQMVLGESLVLSIVGAFVGSACGLALVKFLSKLPNAASVVEGKVAPAVIVQGFAVAIIVGLAGAIYPALWSANLLPTEALRGKA
jgi:putative ABC transport system permease protein